MRALWTVTGIVVPFLWAAGLTVLGYPHPEFLLAGGCFILGGVVLLGTTAMWTYRNWPLKRLQVATAVSLTLLAVGVPVAGILWMTSQKADAQTPSITNNGPSINTFNQSGGNNVINVGPQRLPFDIGIANELANKLPSGKAIDITGTGSQSDLMVASQYAQFLKDKGFDVTFSTAGMVVPPPDHKITINLNGPKVGILIAPSAQ